MFTIIEHGAPRSRCGLGRSVIENAYIIEHRESGGCRVVVCRGMYRKCAVLCSQAPEGSSCGDIQVRSGEASDELTRHSEAANQKWLKVNTEPRENFSILTPSYSVQAVSRSNVSKLLGLLPSDFDLMPTPF